jgi:hypothetical protein
MEITVQRQISLITNNVIICLLKQRSTIVLTVTAVVIASAILLYIASIRGFDPSKRVITDPVEGTETQAVENPAPPQHPAFPSPTANNFSSSTEVTGNNSLSEQASLRAPIAAFDFSHF